MNKNQWHSTSKRNFAVWIAEWETDAPISILDQLLEYMKVVLDAGKETEIFEVQKAHRDRVSKNTYKFEAGDNFSYLDFVHQRIDEENTLYFFPFNLIYAKQQFPENVIPSKICYFDENNQIVTEQVVNVEAILTRSHPYLEYLPEYFSSLSRVIYPNSPIKITGRQHSLDKKKDLVSMGIYLNVDIWFPYVLGLPKEHETQSSTADEHNNSQLARCHTPRFNQFIRTIHQAATELGADWGIGTGFPNIYGKQMHEDGIYWDIDPDEFHEEIQKSKR